ncbi:unnamed protein product, partial [Mesorhabditis spiculigera]
MSRINIVSANFIENPAAFGKEFKLEITFEAFQHLEKDLVWQLVYVGSPSKNVHDQILDSIFIGPTPAGRHQFVLDAPAPILSKIPQEDLVGVAGLLLKIKYNEQEFINLGWFVRVFYSDPEMEAAPPAVPQPDLLTREVMVDDVRVTNIPIKWGDVEEVIPQSDEPIADDDIAIDLTVPDTDDVQGSVQAGEGQAESGSDEEDSEEDEESGSDIEIGSDDSDGEEVEEDEQGDEPGAGAGDCGDEAMEVENAGDAAPTTEKPTEAPVQDALNDVTNA